MMGCLDITLPEIALRCGYPSPELP